MSYNTILIDKCSLKKTYRFKVCMCCRKNYRAEHYYGDCRGWGLCDPCKEKNKGEDNYYIFYLKSLDGFVGLVDLFDDGSENPKKPISLGKKTEPKKIKPEKFYSKKKKI